LVISGNISSYDTNITREEVAIYAFRLKNIVINDKLKTMSLNATAKIDVENNSPTSAQTDGTAEADVIKQNLVSLANNINAGNDPELQEAVQWMYDNGLTIYPTVDEYSPFTTLSREGAAKILHVFANLFNLAESYDTYLPNDCVFSDIGQLDSVLKSHIE
jgi:hypothetical protein